MDIVVYVFAPRQKKARWWQHPLFVSTGWERAVKVELAEPGTSPGQYKPLETLVDVVVPCSADANSGCFVAQGHTMVV